MGAVVGQGTLGGAIMSQGVLDEGISEIFTPGLEGESNYGKVKMAPLMFQDDLSHIIDNTMYARESAMKIDLVLKKKGFNIN